MSSQHALIIGAGVAGPVAALALHRAGIHATVYEAYPTTAHGVGASMGLAANGLDALAALDLREPVRAIGVPAPRMAMLNGSGRVLAELANGLTLADGTTNLTVRRADLYQVLHDEAVRRGVRIEHGKRLTGFEETANGLLARFDDGTEATGDLLVGADGMRSTVRGIVAPGAPRPEYTGLTGTGGHARGPGLDLPQDTFYFVFGKRAFFGYQAIGPEEVLWFANVPTPDEPTQDELNQRTPEWTTRLLVELFEADATPARRLVEATGEYVGWLTMHQMAAPATWYSRRAVLVGDAAHVTSSSSGQGASLAIEDALELARCLRDMPDLAGAFSAYQRLREGRVRKVYDNARKINSSKAAGPVGRVLRDLLLPVFAKKMAKPESVSWLHGHHIEFDAPVDGELRPAA
jgi:2-polyprenyl-6-methoxyphenol hydroxylase-like FAD-dependent oxidoreductase